jgi:hypothetical protein
VAMATHDALLGRPWPSGVFLQEFQIMVGFEHKRIRVADTFDYKFRRVPEVREHADSLRAVTNGESNRVLRVVRNTERIHNKVPDFKCVPCGEEPPRNVSTSIPIRVGLNGFGGEAIGVDGKRFATAHDPETPRVVGVLVGEDDGIETVDVAANELETLEDLAGTQSGVNENRGGFGFNQQAITGTAAPKYCDVHPHER